MCPGEQEPDIDVKLAFRLAWFKVCCPEAFYRSYIRFHNLPEGLLTMTREKREAEMKTLWENKEDHHARRLYEQLALLQEAADLGIVLTD